MKHHLVTAIVVALLFTPTGNSRPVDVTCADTMAAVTKARSDIAIGRGTHAEWLQFRIGDVPPAQIKIWELEAHLRGVTTNQWIAQLQEWDQRWVDNYDNILFVINNSRVVCRG
jgi:hypothetical protein